VGVSDVVVTGPVILPIYKPDNTLLSTCQVVSSSGGSCDVPPLSVDGTYTMSVTSPNTAAVQFSLWLSADVTGTLRPGGAARTFSTDRVGQNARYGFQGTAGRNLSLALTEDVFPGATTVFVYKPDGGRLTAASLVYSSGPGSSTTVYLNNLPATGTYSVFITPSGVATGSITLQLF
jgi:hypothetical protein